MTKPIDSPEPRQKITTKNESPMKGKRRISAQSASPERRLCDIAADIKADWGQKVYFGAVPYLNAMGTMKSIDEKYGEDTGTSVVSYFLSNATSWRGVIARRVKDELKAMLKSRGLLK